VLPWIAVCIYPFLGIAAWHAIYQAAPQTAARHYVIWSPIINLAFLAIAWAIWGQLPLIFVLLVVGITLVNARFVRFCSACGAIQARRTWWSAPVCRRCKGSQFISLRDALKRDKVQGPAA
jgi:hypothetical protein